jgi:hypothetical protein
VQGNSTNGIGVYGYSPNYIGVLGNGSQVGVFGQNLNPAGFAGYFQGLVRMTSDLTVDGTIYGNANRVGGYHGYDLFALAENESVTGRPAFNGGTTGVNAPFSVDSTYVVANLNADMLDGIHAAGFIQAGQASSITTDMVTNGTLLFEDLASNGCASGEIAKYNGSAWVCSADNGSANADTLDGYHAGNSSGEVPVSNGSVNTNLNADLVDGKHVSISTPGNWCYASSVNNITCDQATPAPASHTHWGATWSGSGTGLTLGGGNTGLDGSGNYYGVFASSPNTGVHGEASAGGIGVEGYGDMSWGTGVYGQGNYGMTSYGISYGLSTSSNYVGIETYGVHTGIYAQGGTNAGVFNGNVSVTGDFSVSGLKGAVVKTKDYGTRWLYAVESPENWFEDFGLGKLVNGSATIPIEPIFAQTVNLAETYHVFLTPHGNCLLYIAAMDEIAFTVQTDDITGCDITFDYRIVAKRLGYESTRLEEFVEPEMPVLPGSSMMPEAPQP